MRVSADGGTPELVVATEGEQAHGPQLLPGVTLTRASVASRRTSLRVAWSDGGQHSVARGRFARRSRELALA